MGASLSIAKSLDITKVNIAELEYLHRRYENVRGLKEPIPKVLSRVLTVIFQTDASDELSFDKFLKVFHSWRVSSSTEKLEKLFQILDISDDGALSLSDIAFFCKEDSIKIGDRVKVIKDDRVGILRWRGVLKGKNEEYFGIELDTTDGKNNGSFQGRSYFKCEEGRGIFIHPQAVVSESILSGMITVISEFVKENADKITVEAFKSALMQDSDLLSSLSVDLIPKELSALS